MKIIKNNTLLAFGLLITSFLTGPVAKALTVSAFADFEYNQFGLNNTTSIDPQKKPPYGGFDSALAGLMFQQEKDIYKFYAMLQFRHIAEIADDGDGSGARATGPTSFGEIALERIWVEARFSQAFRLKLGRETTPTLWQQALYPSVYLTMTIPQVETNVFDEYATGLIASGDFSSGVIYNAWLVNSYNTVTTNPGSTSQIATDIRKRSPTIGARLGWKQSDAASSFYIGFIAAQMRSIPDSTALGIESTLTVAKTTLWSSYQRRNDINGKSLLEGGYAILSYAIPFSAESDLSPFIMYDALSDKVNAPNTRELQAVGLNYKPSYYLTTKLEFSRILRNNLEPENTAARIGAVYFFD